MTRVLSAFLATTCLSLGATPASAQTLEGPLPSPAQAELRLERTFENYAQWGEIGRYVMGIGGTVLGPAGIGAGLYFMLDEGSIDREDRRLLTGGVLIGVGAIALAGGIVTLANSSFGADRLAQFQRAREGGLSEREIGMFEGQLRLDAERGRRTRLWQVWAGLAQIVGGGIILVSTAASETSQGDEEVGYILGGVVAGVGAISLTKALLFQSHAERVWQAYLEEEVVPEASAIDIVPAAGPGAARIDVVGRF